MKKIFLILLLAICTTKTIQADEYGNEGTYSISLSCTSLPSYSVKIPTSIDISNPNTTLTFYVKGDIYADQELSVVFDSTATISCANKNETAYISQDKSSWNYSQLTNTYNDSSISISHNDLSAGKWSGILNVVISLQEA